MSKAPKAIEQIAAIDDANELHEIEEKKKHFIRCCEFAIERRDHYHSAGDDLNWKKWNEFHKTAYAEYERNVELWHKVFSAQCKKAIARL